MEWNVIMCISDVIDYYYDIINIQGVQRPFKRGMKPLVRQDHSPSISPCNVELRNRWNVTLTPTYTMMARTGTA
jgi:hypothetical protein